MPSLSAVGVLEIRRAVSICASGPPVESPFYGIGNTIVITESVSRKSGVPSPSVSGPPVESPSTRIWDAIIIRYRYRGSPACRLHRYPDRQWSHASRESGIPSLSLNPYPRKSGVPSPSVSGTSCGVRPLTESGMASLSDSRYRWKSDVPSPSDIWTAGRVTFY